MQPRTIITLATLLALAATTPTALAQAPDDSWREHRFDLGFALFPSFTQQQIEGPDRDDRVVNDARLALVAASTFRIVEWFEAGVYVHFDFGGTERTLYARPDDTGHAAELARIEGTSWELWTALLARFRYGPLFIEVGWAPLMLRHDTARADLPNTSGETDGTFLGSRSVAFMLGVGGRVPLLDRLDLTLRLELRIRYMVERGGEPLAGDEEFGQMAAWPFIGLAYRL